MRRRLAASLLLFTIAGCARIADMVPLAQSPIATPSYCYMPIALNAYEPPTWSVEKGIGTHYPQFCGDAALVGASWRYDWRPDIGDCADVADLPMLYNARAVQVHVMGRLPLGGDGPVLGFNEPDRPDQANMTAYEAARVWPDMEDLAGDRLLIGPAISHEGLAWLSAFHQAHTTLWSHPPRMDGGLAVHCYLNDVGQCQAVVQQVIGYTEDWDLPGVWVTEFMFWPWSPTKELQAREFIAWMEQEPRVLGYAWFPTRLECGAWTWDKDCLFANNALITADGQLTAWGRMYASVGGDE